MHVRKQTKTWHCNILKANVALQHSKTQMLYCNISGTRNKCCTARNEMLQCNEQMLHCNIAIQMLQNDSKSCKKHQKVARIEKVAKRLKKLQDGQKLQCRKPNVAMQHSNVAVQLLGKRALLEPEQLHSSKQNIAVQGTKCCSAAFWRVRIMEEQGCLLTRARHHRCFLSLWLPSIINDVRDSLDPPTSLVSRWLTQNQRIRRLHMRQPRRQTRSLRRKRTNSWSWSIYTELARTLNLVSLKCMGLDKQQWDRLRNSVGHWEFMENVVISTSQQKRWSIGNNQSSKTMEKAELALATASNPPIFNLPTTNCLLHLPQIPGTH